MAYFRAASIPFAVVIGLLFVPFIWDTFVAYQLGLYLLYGMVAQGIALCWGRTGFLPLGQALFFGIGAYVSGAALTQFGDNWLLLIPAFLVAVALPALLACGVGLLVFNRQVGSGPFFSLITLALSILGFQLANSWSTVTGGFNGMTGIPGLPGIDSYEHLYYVILAALLFGSLLLLYLQRAPFGQLLSAIAGNEDRLQFFGFHTGLLKAMAFGVSAGLAGLAGAIYAPHQGIVTPQAVGFLLSAEFVIWTAVGGRNSLMGPVMGAVLIGFLASGLRDTFQYWEVVVALVFIVVVLRFPGGLAQLAERIVPSRHRRTAIQARQRTHTIAGTKTQPETNLKFDHVGLKIGPVTILDNLALDITSKGIHCIIGPNGAGKTSTFNVLSGKLPITSGQISWAGQRLSGMRVDQVAQLGISRKLQVPSVFAALSIDQNIDIALWAGRLRRRDYFSMQPFAWQTELLGDLETRFDFLHNGHAPAGVLSLGQRQMLDFSMTYLGEASLILLDEPCAGLSSAETVEMIEAIAQINQLTGACAIIIEHDMQVVERLSDHVLVMHQGTLLASGTMANIRNNAAVQAVYGGGTK